MAHNPSPRDEADSFESFEIRSLIFDAKVTGDWSAVLEWAHQEADRAALCAHGPETGSPTDVTGIYDAALAAAPRADQLEAVLQIWIDTEHSLGTPMRAFDKGHAGQLWSEREQEMHREMNVNIDHTASADDQRNWNGVREVLRVALAAARAPGREP